MSSICKHWVCIRGREHNFPLQHKCVCLMAGASISVNTEPRYQLILVQPIKSKETETLHSASCPCKALKRKRNEWNVGDVLLTRLFWHKIFISQISQLLARNFKFDLKSHGYYPVTTWVVPRLVLVFPLNQANSRIFVVVLIDFFLWHGIFPSIHVRFMPWSRASYNVSLAYSTCYFTGWWKSLYQFPLCRMDMEAVPRLLWACIRCQVLQDSNILK